MKIKGKEVRLPKAFKKKWIAALRSGEYKQGKEMLYNHDTKEYCCLGVAGIICGLEKHDINGSGLLQEANGYGLEKVPELLVGSDEKDDSDYNIIADKLTIMNDNGKSFNYIASYIERYL
jgi:hypothetical protein